jgi:hypothetical protein
MFLPGGKGVLKSLLGSHCLRKCLIRYHFRGNTGQVRPYISLLKPSSVPVHWPSARSSAFETFHSPSIFFIVKIE